jgi:hypothetical protein
VFLKGSTRFHIQEKQPTENPSAVLNLFQKLFFEVDFIDNLRAVSKADCKNAALPFGLVVPVAKCDF